MPEPQTKTKISSALRIVSFVVCIWIFGLSSAHGASTYSGTPIPFIHPREEWLNTTQLQNLFSWYPVSGKPASEIPDYYPVRQIILHDTGCNATSPGCNNEELDTPTIIQNMFRFHAVTRGWGDIGYHFIIDRKGEIWEGRYGGIGVRGAHLYNSKTCQNFNPGSVGITLLGNYQNASIPQPTLDSLTHLIAWISATNDINPAQTQSFSVWTNPKDEKGRCVASNSDDQNDTTGIEDSKVSGFTSSFTGPVVLTHREIEPANSDIKNIDLASLRNNAIALVPEVKSYAYQAVGENTPFNIVKGALQQLTGTATKIVTVIKKQLDYFKPELFAKVYQPKENTVVNTQPEKISFPDGTLLRAQGEKAVYVVKDGKRAHITAAALFTGLGFSWEKIKEINAQTLASVPLGAPIAFPDGVLIKSNPPEVYLVQGGKRYLISSPELFNAHGFSWQDIAEVDLSEFDRYAWGGYVKWPDGAVLKNQYNENQVFAVKDGALQPLETVNGTTVHLVNGREIASYQSAQVLTPTVKLALSQALEQVKNTFGLNGQADNQPTTNRLPATQTPASVEQQESSTIPTSSEPTIRIALCRNRDIQNCTFSVTEALSIVDNGNGTMTVTNYQDRPGFNTTLNDNTFRGKVYTTASDQAGKVWLVNELSLENYLKGIAETLGEDAPEYRKGLITMARTYAYNYITHDKKHPGKPFDLTNTSFDQVYRGYNYEMRSNGLPAVVDATKGSIITYNDKPIVAAYSSDSGGVTKNACSVWQKYCGNDGALDPDFAYLKGGISDPEGTIHNQAKIQASHGVGVSTTGARRLIELGKTYADMISYYYPGVIIKNVY